MEEGFLMRKFHIVLLVLIAMIGVLVAPATFAQETTLSTGCSGLASDFLISGSSYSGSFTAGESITFAADSDFVAGNSYTVTVGGVATVVNAATYTHSFAADAASVTIQVTVTTGTFTVSVACDQASEVEDFTLCHIPPGNPAAAHTITVGSQNAYDTHLDNHGDTPGACPEGVDSREDDFSSGLVIYIIIVNNPDDDSDVEGGINIWGDCDEGECESLVEISIDVIIALNGTLAEGEYEEFDDDDDDGYTVRIYFLGYQDRDGDGVFQDVLQINIYFNDVLTNDDVLILIGDDGSVGWTTNDDLGVDISIIFGDGDDDDSDDVEECDADGADDTADTDDDEVCEDEDGDDDADDDDSSS
jgi:hypothetical protein